MTNPTTFDIINVRITHKKARLPLLEAVAFKDLREAYEEIKKLGNISECIILQTCNRVEIYVVSYNGEVIEKLKNYLANRAEIMKDEVYNVIEVSKNHEALEHILNVASGLDSMVLGENEILGQVWNAYFQAEVYGSIGPILRTIFKKAIKVGRRVRNETEISKGSISFASLSIKLAEEALGGLNGKNVLIIGAGEMGTCVAKAIAHKKLNTIFIANRTYERAIILARKISGRALRFDKLEEALIEADVIICTTAAPHYILTKDDILRAINRRNKREILIIDLSNPRNVEESIAELDGVTLYNIDDFRSIIERNLAKRKESIERAKEIIKEEMPRLYEEIKICCIKNLISQIISSYERIRREELNEALRKLEKINDKEIEIIDNLTKAIFKRILHPIIENLKIAILNGDKQIIENFAKIFGVELIISEWRGFTEEYMKEK